MADGRGRGGRRMVGSVMAACLLGPPEPNPRVRPGRGLNLATPQPYAGPGARPHPGPPPGGAAMPTIARHPRSHRRAARPTGLALLAALLGLAAAGCSSGGGSPPPACSYTYSAWSECGPAGAQVRTVTAATPEGCAGTPLTSQACTFAPLLHVPSPDWRDQVIYFVMTDRFANGDRTNDDQGQGEYDPSTVARYSGGDLQGLIDRLDYVQGLGATAVWITPPVANQWWDPLQVYGGYHGYWARHLKRVDEHLGTLATYQALSDALHRRGMYLVQDVVANHMGNFHTWAPYPAACAPSSSLGGCATGPAIAGCDVTQGFVRNTAAVPTSRPEQAPFDQDDATDPVQRAAGIYHWTPAIADYLNACQERAYQLSDLDDLATENPLVRAALKDSYGYWVKEVGVDAFRVDTVRFVEHEFWNDFFHSTSATEPGILAQAATTGRTGFLAFGEVFEVSEPGVGTADVTVTSYLGTPAAPELPAVLQFPLFAELGRVFGAPAAPTTDLTYRVRRFMDLALYPDPFTTPTFVDNHDVPRFLANGTPAGLAQALTFLFTSPGIPVVYYGTEQEYAEPRAAMFQGGYGTTGDRYDTTSAGYRRLAALAALRRAHPVFSRGAMTVLADSPAGAGPFAYRRTLGAETALVLMNTSESRMLVSGLATGLPAGAVLEVLHAEGSPTTPTVGEGGLLTTVLPARAVLVLRATGAVVAPPPPPVTITVTTPVEGQVFSGDVTLTGTVSPPTTRIRLVIDGYVDRIATPTVAADGSFSIVLPVSTYAVGVVQHTLAFYALAERVATPTVRFTSDVVFDPVVTEVADPAGDDTGPSGTYRYPGDATFATGRYGDVTGLTIQAATTTLKLVFHMADLSTVWNPGNGFDHVSFNVFFEVPGFGGATVLPLMDAAAPAGFTWKFNQTTYGFANVMNTSSGASATEPGALGRAPKVAVDLAAGTITFTYNRADYGLATWSGVRVYATTWDIDGLGGLRRALTLAGGPWEFGGAAGGPLIMDSVGPVAIP
ncbi:MAG: alpha-amylase [Anaeromyxobacter sp.]|nr:alpha-amylase [Anaeromyxobacter sp.]MBL0275899.1 alpha-amylase [Anaeromyxobacter sp.]